MNKSEGRQDFRRVAERRQAGRQADWACSEADS